MIRRFKILAFLFLLPILAAGCTHQPDPPGMVTASAKSVDGDLTFDRMDSRSGDILQGHDADVITVRNKEGVVVAAFIINNKTPVRVVWDAALERWVPSGLSAAIPGFQGAYDNDCNGCSGGGNLIQAVSYSGSSAATRNYIRSGVTIGGIPVRP